MNQIVLRVVIATLSFAAVNQASSAPNEGHEYAMARHHHSDSMFFEQLENGIAGYRIAFQFNAEEEKDGSKWAECTYTVIYVDKDKKRSEMTLFHASTNDNSIKNLSVSPKSVSFDIDTGWFEQGGGTRQIKFVASRQGSSSAIYQASATGLWRSMFDETKLMKIEWKQVPSIALPYPLSP